MMPLGAALLVILAMPRVVAGPRRRLLAVAAITFATSVAPYVFELSRGLRRLSFGEAGRLNYAWLVSREIPSTAGWVGHTRESGNPLHPPRLLRVEPTVLEFNRTVPGTYPLWYNPSFFHEGLQVHFDARKQAAALTGSCPAIVAAHGSEWGQLLAGIGILAAFVVRRRLEFKFSNLWLVLWALSAVSLFALVASILARHVSPFIVLFWLAAYASFSPGALPADRALHRKLTSAVALFVLLPQAVLLGAAALYSLRTPQPDAQIVVARELTQLGLRPGEEIATVGYPFSVYYARLARLRVVSNIGFRGEGAYDSDRFWTLNDASLKALDEDLRRCGVKAIVSSAGCGNVSRNGWRPIEDTAYCVQLLD